MSLECNVDQCGFTLMKLYLTHPACHLGGADTLLCGIWIVHRMSRVPDVGWCGVICSQSVHDVSLSVPTPDP